MPVTAYQQTTSAPDNPIVQAFANAASEGDKKGKISGSSLDHLLKKVINCSEILSVSDLNNVCEYKDRIASRLEIQDSKKLKYKQGLLSRAYGIARQALSESEKEELANTMRVRLWNAISTLKDAKRKATSIQNALQQSMQGIINLLPDERQRYHANLNIAYKNPSLFSDNSHVTRAVFPSGYSESIKAGWLSLEKKFANILSIEPRLEEINDFLASKETLLQIDNSWPFPSFSKEQSALLEKARYYEEYALSVALLDAPPAYEQYACSVALPDAPPSYEEAINAPQTLNR